MPPLHGLKVQCAEPDVLVAMRISPPDFLEESMEASLGDLFEQLACREMRVDVTEQGM
jgi:hypothetical protein